MTVEPTYFTCTLGQAAALGIQQQHKTINSFLDARGIEEPDRPIVGFATPTGDGPWAYQICTFSDVVRGSRNLAAHLRDVHSSRLSTQTTIALLCPSTLEFLLTWLALIRLGHAVLLIAPQCPPMAIQSLCDQCKAGLLLFDESYSSQAKDACSLASSSGATLNAAALPFRRSISLQEVLTGQSQATTPCHTVQGNDIAYLHHTSGTSTGIPKPIPQTHNAAIGVLPSFQLGHDGATFTTTPLYHGGVADLFRAWTSSALIWLFPSKAAPITAINVVKCLDVAARAAQEDASIAKVKYFSSVPYVLQLVESNDDGLEHLRSMSMVGVGGAALPRESGDRLVLRGVNLLSRFGSAECGFLLSSHRDYANDKEWQYLRQSPDQDCLRFEEHGNGLSELVVLKGWPHMAKVNRENGSFATSDVFMKHEKIPGAWKYHSRADSQLTLITGKKFDPSPLEAAIATSDLLRDVLVFGNGRPFPGALLFRSQSAAEVSDEELLERVWPTVDKLNLESQDHACISRSMLVPMPVLEQELDKSSKGTIMRGASEKRFETQIDNSYDNMAGESHVEVADGDLVKAIREMVVQVCNRKIDLKDHSDLFSAGIDSIAGMQIRSRMRALLSEDDRTLPMTVIEDQGTVAALAEYVRKRRHGQIEDVDTSDESTYMRQVVDEFSHFGPDVLASDSNAPPRPKPDGEVVVLTGATGALGAHVLDQYRKMETVRRIYCLVRGTDAHAAQQRVTHALQNRKLASLDAEKDGKVVVLQAQLGDASLGLDKPTYELLACEATIVMHVAWSVNFRMRLSSFVSSNIASVRNLIDLALSSQRSTPPVFAFCSSVASVMAHPAETVPERLIDDPNASSALGYSKSKWVGEQICARASQDTRLRGRMAIYRVGQLAGDSEHGVWNNSEAWPIMLSSVTETGCLPMLENEVVNWLPVDIAATALIQGAQHTGRDKVGDGEGADVYHVVNDHSTPGWMEMLTWLGKHESFERVTPAVWVEKISDLEIKGSRHAAIKLLSHWRGAYTVAKNATGNSTDGNGSSTFATGQTKEIVPVLRRVEPVDERYFGKLWQWIRREM